MDAARLEGRGLLGLTDPVGRGLGVGGERESPAQARATPSRDRGLCCCEEEVEEEVSVARGEGRGGRRGGGITTRGEIPTNFSPSCLSLSPHSVSVWQSESE